ncbi:MAG: type II toxin-antitoxin system RelB/DinJ family antitoxin [Clostridia bacterium]|nr:type II toxin-antitoxin system RelB/DinJ family antitoxin [Clostridia bacterium]
MEKTATLNLRVNPAVKHSAEEVLAMLGIPMSVAIDMYLNQISLTGGIPFAVILPKAPASVNADEMTDDELREKLKNGYDDIAKGNVRSVQSAFSDFRETHRQ